MEDRPACPSLSDRCINLIYCYGVHLYYVPMLNLFAAIADREFEVSGRTGGVCCLCLLFVYSYIVQNAARL